MLLGYSYIHFVLASYVIHLISRMFVKGAPSFLYKIITPRSVIYRKDIALTPLPLYIIDIIAAIEINYNNVSKH